MPFDDTFRCFEYLYDVTECQSDIRILSRHRVFVNQPVRQLDTFYVALSAVSAVCLDQIESARTADVVCSRSS